MRKNRHISSGEDSLHKAFTDRPMEVGSVPYDDEFDVGSNGRIVILERVKLDLWSYGLYKFYCSPEAESFRTILE